MRRIRVGLVGAGFVADIHVNAYRRVVGVPVEVAGVVTRTRANAERFAHQYGIPRVYDDYRQMLDDDEIDIVDICAPNIAHKELCVDAAEAGKHIICEKPLTGAFGEGFKGANQVVGRLPRMDMYREAMKNANEILAAAKRNNVKICYAEDFVYAPPVVKAKRLLKQSGGAILEIRSEESHSGSHASYARHWSQAGGGSLLRLGSHPLGVVLHLKHYEGYLRRGAPFHVMSVIADVGLLTRTEVFKSAASKWIANEWDDVEDWASVILTFDDGTKALVMSNDVTLGGIVNKVEVYTTNCVIKCNMASNDSITAYAPADEVFGDEYISEKIQTKAGWTFPSPDEDWMRGYPQEMQDFVEAVWCDREPISDGELGRQVVQVTYAAYLSAEQGRRINIGELDTITENTNREE